MTIGPEGAFPRTAMPCGDAEPFALVKPSDVTAALDAPITDPSLITGILCRTGVPEVIARALVSGLRSNSDAVGKIDTARELMIAGELPKATHQLGLALLAATSTDGVGEGKRADAASSLGCQVIACFRQQTYPGVPCGDPLDSFKSPEQQEIEVGLVKRLTELGQSLRLSETVASVVAHGVVEHRHEILDATLADPQNIAAVGKLFLAQINEAGHRPLTEREAFLRGSETGSLVIQLLSEPSMTGWESRSNGVIFGMRTFNP